MGSSNLGRLLVVAHTYRRGHVRIINAKDVTDMKFPGSDLHQLKGKMKGLWAVKVLGNWRVVFSFREANAYDVNYIDYH